MESTTQPSFLQLTDLVAEKLGGKVLYATDDFFAEKENLIKSGRGIFIVDKYTDRGKWMDGWESRRKRVAGHDWCVIQLANPGVIRGFDVDTNHFLGNHPPFARIEACYSTLDPFMPALLQDEIEWTEILPKSPLNPGSQHFLESHSDQVYSHIRLHIYPDGGVARLKVYGEIDNSALLATGTRMDLAAAINGGRALMCNDMFFSSMNNLIMPGRGVNMGDGWETKRNRTPNNRDWVILKLATKGQIQQILVDTCHFKGNYPDRCSIDACIADNDAQVTNEEVEWFSILPEVKLQAHHEHYFISELIEHTACTHVRLNIFPDGGVSRLRLYGIVV